MHKKQKEITIFDIRQHQEPKPRLLGGSGFRKKVWLRLGHTENNNLKTRLYQVWNTSSRKITEVTYSTE